MLCQVPYEAYRKIFRTSQRYVERELGSVQSTARELSKLNNSTYNPEEALKSVETMIKKVEGLKRKVRREYCELGEDFGVHLEVVDRPTRNIWFANTASNEGKI